jgi:vanillate O-demethylase ferredoxin subunit
MERITVKVAGKRHEAQDIASFELVPAVVGTFLPAFEPGAHIDVHLPGGMIRQYSLWNSPQESNVYRIGVLKDLNGRGGSIAMHDLVEVDALLQISPPRNLFSLASSQAPSLLLAGGIGITPILSMAERLLVLGSSFAFHYCAKSSAKAAFLERLSQSDISGKVKLHFDDGTPEQRIDIAKILRDQKSDCNLYICGPKGFMDAVLSLAREIGWEENRLHYESFQADVQSKANDQPFKIKILKTGQTIQVASDQSATQALAAAGIVIPISCEQGICGTCLTNVVEGIPEHRDSFLMPAEQLANTCFTPCCSRALTSTLVIDF